MIGGTDTIIPTDAGPARMRLALKVILAHWPDAVAEDANTGEPFSLRPELPASLPDELFVYQDSPTACSWEQLGPDPSLANTMLHLIRSDDNFTVVDDNPAPDILLLAHKIDACIRPIVHYTGRR
ncbi:hypothetical protein [Tautonia plasticadhaerens]|uniref:Uncharacterized protein n=1 Tax=Tautonia plasticadhaerens TaxID=2527974 RepID=A0A518GV69_9BACT|nr:hypothetical protein [Tautonia plasticadhaerens]QDV32485.1 hypothetical protein ElP_03180 [Tautonia plasticadhaerens]